MNCLFRRRGEANMETSYRYLTAEENLASTQLLGMSLGA